MVAETLNHRSAEPDEVEREFGMLIDGTWVGAESGATFRCRDPFTGAAWGHVPVAGSAEVNEAVEAARRAFDTGG